MSNFPELLGQWSRDTSNGVDVVHVIEIVNGVAKAIGKNIPVDELKAKYKKIDASKAFGDPYGTIQGNALKGLDRDIILDRSETPEDQIEAEALAQTPSPGLGSILADATLAPKPQTKPQVKQVDQSWSTPQHQFISNAINLQNEKGAKSKLSLHFDVVLPCDIDKLKQVASSMDITSEVVSEVLMVEIRKQADEFFSQVNTAVAENLKSE